MREHDVVILPSSVQVEAWRKARADEFRAGSFAQAITTFDNWIADLWELHGDGRSIVNAVQREVLMRKAFQDVGGDLALPGMAGLAASCVREAAGIEAFDAAVAAARAGEAVAGLSEEEMAFLRAIDGYLKTLADMKLVEPGDAAAALVVESETVFPRPVSVLVAEAEPLTWMQSRFLESCPSVSYEVAFAEEKGVVPQAPGGIEVRHLFPTGPTAEPGLIADAIESHAGRGDVVVTCKDPLFMYERTRQRLADLGLRVRVRSRKPFNQTDFGRTVLSMYRFLHSNPWEGETLSDVLLSPFSGFSHDRAIKLDKKVRADRIANRDETVDRLTAESAAFGNLVELLSSPEAGICLDGIEKQIEAADRRSPAWRAEQVAAIVCARSVMAVAHKAGATMEEVVATLDRANLPVSVEVAGEGPTVLFTTQGTASRMGRGCCASLIAADLTTEDYPLADKDDAASTLFSKLGLEPVDTPLARARRQFKALLKLPSERVDFVRPLANADANETYPAAMLEEFIDSYRSDLSTDEDIDNKFRLPEELQDKDLVRGEELLYENVLAGTDGRKQGVSAETGPLRFEEHDPEQVRALLKYVPVGPDCEQRVKLSPSQIEKYLECPYKWFVEAKLRPETLDEECGAREKGIFAHESLKEFHEGFDKKVKKGGAGEQGNLDEAKALMRKIVDEKAAGQCGEEPGGRLVPANKFEEREIDVLCDQLVSFLDYEAEFLPSFHPAYLEFEIDGEEGSKQYVDYAGCALGGTVDRIDVRETAGGAKKAVIVDYKVSVSKNGYSIHGKDPDNPGKVQALIYAQAVKRVLGLDVVGAVYVSYGNDPEVKGAYDGEALSQDDIPRISKYCACGKEDEKHPEAFANLSFAEVLDAVEDVVSKVVSSIEAGEIDPNPSSKDVCEYCPVVVCPRRIA